MADHRRLAGRVVLITGASRGLGHALAEALEAVDARLALCARSEAGLAELAGKLRARRAARVGTGGGADPVFTAAIDVRDAAAVQRFVDETARRFDRLDVVVNNAGSGSYRPFLADDVDDLDRTIDVCLKGPMYVCRAALPHLLRDGGGHVVNVASDLARRPLAQMAPYVAAKHGLLGFGASLLREYKDRGLRVTTFNPGIMDTWFGGGRPGRPAAGALAADTVAAMLVDLLSWPAELLVDEITAHPPRQEF
ncbi:MAG: SDR family NAD(P)-dependent oxidoreductase [Myxococcales bacterium]|nr:SDR family NAD(P)-dependent oxidoreductase [Myxococcales bacterium]